MSLLFACDYNFMPKSEFTKLAILLIFPPTIITVISTCTILIIYKRSLLQCSSRLCKFIKMNNRCDSIRVLVIRSHSGAKKAWEHLRAKWNHYGDRPLQIFFAK